MFFSKLVTVAWLTTPVVAMLSFTAFLVTAGLWLVWDEDYFIWMLLLLIAAWLMGLASSNLYEKISGLLLSRDST